MGHGVNTFSRDPTNGRGAGRWAMESRTRDEAENACVQDFSRIPASSLQSHDCVAHTPDVIDTASDDGILNPSPLHIADVRQIHFDPSAANREPAPLSPDRVDQRACGTMSIQVKCPSKDCDQQLMLSPEMAGKKGQCPKCGKTFQIPANLGAKKTGGAKAGSGAQKAPAGGNVMSSNDLANYIVPEGSHPESAPEVEVMDYEAEVVEDYEDYDAYDDFEAPRRRRRRDDYDDEDEDDEFASSARGKSGLSKTRKRKLLNVGFLILAIATCVFAGAMGLSMLGELFGEIAIAAKSPKMGKAFRVFLRISQVLGFISSLGLVTAYVFCLFAPNKHGSLGLMIAALSVGAVNMVMWIVFKMVPAFGDKLIYSRSLFAAAGGQHPSMDIGSEILFLFLELALIAEFVLVTLFMAAVARTQKDKAHTRDCMRTVWFLTAVACVVLIETIFMMPDYDDRWPVYLIRVMNWGANGVLVLALVFHIMNLFYSWKSTR